MQISDCDKGKKKQKSVSKILGYHGPPENVWNCIEAKDIILPNNIPSVEVLIGRWRALYNASLHVQLG